MFFKRISILNVIILLCNLSLINSQQKACNKIRVRPEIRDLNAEQLDTLVSVIKQLNSGPRPTKYDVFANIHINNAMFAHGTAQFLQWHREYIWQFEKLLQEVNPSVMLPYWDWSADYLNPAQSWVMKDFLGGNGVEPSRCVESGRFANWTAFYPNLHCLQREYDMDDVMSPYYSTASLQTMIKNTTDFYDYTTTIEGLPHSIVHINIGTDLGDMNYFRSSNDLAFWLHHGFIDLLYWEWQQQKPEISNTFFGNTWDNKEATEDDTMPPFNLKVKEAFDTTNGRYCYTYDRLGTKRGDIAASRLPPTVLDPNSPNTKTQLNALESKDMIDAVQKASVPKPVPDEWILRNNMNSTKIRETEKRFRKHYVQHKL